MAQTRQQLTAYAKEWFRKQSPEYRAASAARTKAWRQLHPMYPWEMRIKSLYGLTPTDYLRILERQKYVCGICGEPFRPSPRSEAVDHDHATGQVRGVLCTSCNHILRDAKDDPKRLDAAADYLRRVEN